jgi:hypothetical protein
MGIRPEVMPVIFDGELLIKRKEMFLNNEFGSDCRLKDDYSIVQRRIR